VSTVCAIDITLDVTIIPKFRGVYQWPFHLSGGGSNQSDGRRALLEPQTKTATSTTAEKATEIPRGPREREYDVTFNKAGKGYDIPSIQLAV
jgi:hypothetical protein